MRSAKKRIVVPALFCFFAALLLILSGCGGEPLEKAFNDIDKNEDIEAKTVVKYHMQSDTLEVGIYQDADIDALFEILNKDLSGADVGTLLFRTYFNVPAEDLSKFSEKIGELEVGSIGMLGVDGPIAGAGNHKWLGAATKAEKIYVPQLSDFEGYTEEELKDIKTVWTGGTVFGGIENLPDLTEVAIDAKVEPNDVETGMQVNADIRTDEDGKLESSEEGVAEEGTAIDTADDTATSANATEESAQDGEEGEEKVEAVTFDPGYYNGVETFMPLKKAAKLERILIMPTEEAYTFGPSGAGFIYGIQNVKPDVMMNKPDEAFSKDNLVKASEIDISKIDQNGSLKQSILEGFLKEEIKGCYSKGIKADKSSKTPVVTGRALVFKATPDPDDWASKRKYYSNGSIINGVQLSGKIPTPKYAGDYDTFIYVYPVYSRTGVYTSGTKAYSETYMAQVFDLKNNIAYEPQKIGSAAAPQSFRYVAGNPPSKKSGDVSEDKILSYLKKLKTAE